MLTSPKLSVTIGLSILLAASAQAQVLVRDIRPGFENPTAESLTDPSGGASIPVPVPNTAAIVGAELYLQWAVLDPLGAFANFLAFSDGLYIRIGRS